ncbi:MAG TPA: hypothetical protein VM118_07350 [Acidobacteriota bacterium]|nr:hypothetical protein [Acidobacteriota bacterium]
MSFRQWFDSQRAISHEKGPAPLTDEEEAIMTRMAKKVVEWKMTVPAIMFLEMVKPLNYIGAQAMVFFEPFVQTIFNFRDYDTFRQMMERRESVERLLQKIEELDAQALTKEKDARRRRGGERGRRWWWPFGGSTQKPPEPGEPPVIG